MDKVTESVPVKITPEADEEEDHALMQTCYVCESTLADPQAEDDSLLVCDACDFSVAHY